MRRGRRPPALILKTVAATFITAAILLSAIFAVVTFSARKQVRGTVRDQLESSQRMIGAMQSRAQHDMRLQAANLADSPTLKAAIDTYAAESRQASSSVHTQLLNTITNELAKVAELVEADAIVAVDTRGRALAAAGRLSDRWRTGQAVPLVTDNGQPAQDGIVHIGADIFRVVTVPLTVGDGTPVGTLYLATTLDRRFAQDLSGLARTETAIVSDGRLVTSTLADDVQRDFAGAVPTIHDEEGTVVLAGESHAFRRLVQIGDTSVYALASVDAAARPAIRETNRALGLIAIGAFGVALIGSLWLAHLLSAPIGALSTSLDRMAASRQFGTRLPRSGSSLEIDRLTDTFNALMSSVAAAEAETQVAYTAAIRALAAALDARDPYTAGHSERVSTISVAIGQVMELPPSELEVVRLGALLHDIGKIGVPDEILKKPGRLTDAEFDIIKQHPGLGARILRTVPFLSPHLPIVELHHERPDGSGYPYGLPSQDIPLAAHIVHVADAYDAMTSARAYRRERPAGAALRELWAGAGTDFHADAVAALARALPELTAVLEDSPMEALSA